MVLHQETQELPRGNTNDAFVGVEHDVDLAEVPEGLLEVIDERALFASLDDDVVNVSVIVPPHLASQGDAHQPLESSARYLQAERHADVAEYAARGHELRLLLVVLGHLDLVVPRESVQKAQEVNFWEQA